MRTYVIGDVHGMDRELIALWSELDVRHDDRVVSVGDLLDKGPDSGAVVRFLRERRDEGHRVDLVMGNHEEKHAKFRSKRARGGDRAVRKLGGRQRLEAITDALSSADIAFLDSAVPFLRLEDHGAVVLHAGLTPDIEVLDDTPRTLSRLLRTRHVRGRTTRRVTVEFVVDSEEPLSIEELVRRAHTTHIVSEKVRERGSFVQLDRVQPEDPFWAEVYDGRFGHVYFGHEPFVQQQPKHFEHATGLDTGCVFGGWLTAAVLVAGEVPSFVSVPAQRREDWDFAALRDAFVE